MKETMEEIEYTPYSYRKDMLLFCSIGLNIGFIIGLILYA